MDWTLGKDASVCPGRRVKINGNDPVPSQLSITTLFNFNEATLENLAVILVVVKLSSLYLGSRNLESLH